MRKREMKIGMKVIDSEFEKWGTGTIIDISDRVAVKFRKSNLEGTSYGPGDYKFLKEKVSKIKRS